MKPTFSLSAKAGKQNKSDSDSTASACFNGFIFTPYLTLETEPFGLAKNASKLTPG